MIKKKLFSDKSFEANVYKFISDINDNSDFLFYFSPDPDAIGASIALSLYLSRKSKNSTIFLPDIINPNLDFLLKIAVYNNIYIISDLEEMLKLINNKNITVITCDTPSHYLLPDYCQLKKNFHKNNNICFIEIDHHFSGDSEKIFKNSLCLFKKSNSTSEIVAEVFEMIGRYNDYDNYIDLMFPRNIVLSLLVGICFDTHFGKFVIDANMFEKWFELLSHRLVNLTWGNKKYIQTAEEVFNKINQISLSKKKVINKLLNDMVVINSIGLLILPEYNKYDSLSDDGDPTCILYKIIPDLTNMSAERSKKIGIVAYYDDSLDLFLIKIRRSSMFNSFDIRKIDKLLKKIFKKNFLGGGGHEGATSFKIKKMERSQFIDDLKTFQNQLAVKFFL
ncbi:MAG: hypothetical protein JXB50_06230 [Spirochaetes bacterium]|nr:hypothetical protein [Spirochaetota bacterium]